MRMLVTGGAGFIGSHYVRTLLDRGLAGSRTPEPSSSSTSSPTPATSPTSRRSPTTALQVRPGRHLRRRARRRADAPATTPSSTSPPSRTSTAPSHAPPTSSTTNVVGHPDPARRGAAAPGRPLRARLAPTRSTARSTTGSWTEERAAAAQLAVLRLEGRPPTSSPAPTTAPTGCDVSITRCSNNYGPYQYPEKVIPLFVTNLHRRRHGAAVRRRAATCATGCTSTTTAAASSWCSTKGAPGEVYNIGGGTELTNRRADRAAARGDRLRPGRVSLRSTDRQGHDRRYSVDISKISERARLRAARAFERGAGRHREWYRDQPRLVGAAQAGGRSSLTGAGAGAVGRRLGEPRVPRSRSISPTVGCAEEPQPLRLADHPPHERHQHQHGQTDAGDEHRVRLSPCPSGAQPALSSSATPDIVSTMTMPRRMTDWGTLGARREPSMEPGTDPMISGIVSDQSRPWAMMFAIAADEHQRHRLHQVGPDQPHGRQRGVEHQQRDHDDRAGPDRGDADQQPTDGTDEDRRDRPDVRLRRSPGCRAGSAAGRCRAAARRWRRRSSSAKPIASCSVVSISVGSVTALTRNGPRKAIGTEPTISHLASCEVRLRRAGRAPPRHRTCRRPPR